MPLTLAAAQTIVTVALDHARKSRFKPLGIVVLDQRGVIKAAAFEDGTSLKRYEIAHGKAFGAVALGTGSRALAKRVAEQPHFIAAARHAIGGALVPAPGGVLIKDASGEILGAVGISGDTSDNDEAAAAAGITAAGHIADGG
ncbi:MAG: heme-binding protein [Beijerinckiaceae bacterium]